MTVSTEENVRNEELKAKAQVEQTQVYTAKDVAQHNTKNDLWIIIHGKGMSVSSYNLGSSIELTVY